MKITGVTIIRNAIKNDYPVVESIASILPVVDEMIVTIDKGEDETDSLIKNIRSNKIKIVYTQWDLNIRKGGEVLAVETNKALQHVSVDTDWIFYIQGDEVIHEKYHESILAAARHYKEDTRIDGLLFNYLHFYGTYDYVGDSRKWYNCETRIIRNDPSIQAYKDAQGFRRGNEKIAVAAIPAFVYHYGWVKSPKQMKQKQKNVGRFWNDDNESFSKFLSSEDFFDFSEYDSIKKFEGTHPVVMQKRINEMNWHVELDVNMKKMSLKNKLLHFLERITGKRLFTFSNHKIITRFRPQ